MEFSPNNSTGKVSVDLDSDGIVRLTFKAPGETPEEHDRMAEETREAYEKLKSLHPDGQFRVLVDLTNAGIPTQHAREVYIKTLSDKRIKKTAFFGVGGAIKTIVSFIVSASGKGEEVKFFINQEEALSWLRAT